MTITAIKAGANDEAARRCGAPRKPGSLLRHQRSMALTDNNTKPNAVNNPNN